MTRKIVDVVVIALAISVAMKIYGNLNRHKKESPNKVTRDKVQSSASPERFPIITPDQGKQMTDRISDLMSHREQLLDYLIQRKKDKIVALEAKVTSYQANPEFSLLATRTQKQIESEQVLITSYERQKKAILLLRIEIQAGNIKLELAQLPDTHVVILVKDVSQTIRDPDARPPDFSEDETLARLVIDGLAPAVFDPNSNPVKIHDILILGLPNVRNSQTRRLERVLVYTFAFPYERARLVLDWNENESGNEIETIFRATSWER